MVTTVALQQEGSEGLDPCWTLLFLVCFLLYFIYLFIYSNQAPASPNIRQTGILNADIVPS